MPPKKEGNLFKEPNAYRQLYHSLCFGVLYIAWGSYQSLILLLFSAVKRDDMAYWSMMVYFLIEGIFYLFFGHYFLTKIPTKRRNIVYSLCIIGYILYLLAAMNMASCYNEETDLFENTKFTCKGIFIYPSMLISSSIGGMCDGLIGTMQFVYTAQCARLGTRARLVALLQSILVASWAIGLVITQIILHGVNGSIYQYLKIITIISSFSAVMFLFLPPPIPPKVDLRDQEQREEDSMEKAADIIDEIFETQDPKLEKLVQPVTRTFSEERAVIKYLKLNKQEIKSSGKDIKISQFVIRTKELWSYLRNDIIIGLLVPSYFVDGLTSAWWVNCSLWIVTTIQSEKEREEIDSKTSHINLVINVDIAAKVCELIFLNVWGEWFDRAGKQWKKSIQLLIYVLISFYLGMTMLGYTVLEYEVFYGVAVFYGVSMQGLKVTSGPLRNEIYAPDQRKILYGAVTHKFIVNFLSAFGFFVGKYLIHYNPLYYILIIVPFWIWSFINMVFRVQYKG